MRKAPTMWQQPWFRKNTLVRQEHSVFARRDPKHWHWSRKPTYVSRFKRTRQLCGDTHKALLRLQMFINDHFHGMCYKNDGCYPQLDFFASRHEREIRVPHDIVQNKVLLVHLSYVTWHVASESSWSLGTSHYQWGKHPLVTAACSWCGKKGSFEHHQSFLSIKLVLCRERMGRSVQ